MTRNGNEIVIPLGGEFFIAPVGTAIPATTLAMKGALPTGWIGLGYATQEGVTISQERTLVEIPAWGSNGLPVKRKVTGRKINFGGSMLQSNDISVKNWFGSTDFAADGGTGGDAGWRADIEIDVPIFERALLIRWKLEGKDFGIGLKRVDMTPEGSLTIVDNDAQKFGLTMTSMVPDAGTILGSLLTDHPAFNPAT